VTARISKSDALLKMLKEYTSLRRLSIEFTNEHLDPERPNLGAENCWFRLQGFKNLTSLELYFFYAGTARLVKDIANNLTTSVHLKKLGSAELARLMLKETRKCCFGEAPQNLCDHYASHPGTSPLAFDILRLGHGMLCYKRGKATSLDF